MASPAFEIPLSVHLLYLLMAMLHPIYLVTSIFTER
jgi:hypothetical protein